VVTPRRGEIWWLRQETHPAQATDTSKGRRPYLIVSGDPWNLEARYPRITVCPLTGAENIHRRYDTDVVLRARETHLKKDSVVRCVELYTVFRDLLIERAASLTDKRMLEVENALRLYLSLGGPAR
jgi:mRNA-degrading endonuclease toxin of MazEF toxin-antitoxin module